MDLLLHETLNSIQQILQPDCLVFYPYDPTKGEFHARDEIIICGKALPLESVDKPRAKGLIRLVLQLGELIVPNIDNDDPILDKNEIGGIELDGRTVSKIIRDAILIKLGKIRAFMAISVRFESDRSMPGKAIELGVMCLTFFASHQFRDQETQAVRASTTWIAKLIHNIQTNEIETKSLIQTINIYETTLKMSQLSDVDKMCKSILDDATRLLGVSGGKLYFRHFGQDILELVAIKGIDSDVIKPGHMLMAGEGIAGQVALRHRAIRIKNYAKWPGHIKQLARSIAAIVAVPVIFNDELLGVLAVFDNLPKREFAQSDSVLLEEMARNRAIVIKGIHHARDHQLSQLHSDALHQISQAIASQMVPKELGEKILDELRPFFNYRKASLQILKGDKRELVARRGYSDQEIDKYLLRPVSKDRLIQRVFASRQPLIISNTSLHPDWDQNTGAANVKSWIAVPIFSRAKPIGLITLDHDTEGFYRVVRKDLLNKFGIQASMALENMLLSSATESRVRDTEIVGHILQAMGIQLDADKLLKTVVTQISQKLDCRHCTIFFPEIIKGQLWLVPHESRGRGRRFILKRHFQQNEGIVGWVFSEGQSVLLEDARNDSRFMPARRAKQKPRSMIAAPIKVGYRTIGVITVDQDKQGAFDEEDKRLLTILAQQSGIAIERSIALKLVQDISSRILYAESVSEILETIVSGTIRLSNSRVGVIHLISDDGKSVETTHQYPLDIRLPDSRFNKGLGVTYEIVQTGKQVIIEDANQDARPNPAIRDRIRSLIGVPLKLEKKTIGALFLFDSSLHQFTETEVSLLNILAAQTAIAIRNTLMQGQTRDQKQKQIQAIHEITDSITTLTNLDQTLNKILEWTAPLLDRSELAEIRLLEKKTKELVVKATTGHRLHPQHLRIPIKYGLTGWVVRNNEPVNVGDVRKDKRYLLGVRGTRSELVVPMPKNGEAIGVLNFEHPKFKAFDGDHLELAKAISGLAVLAIEHHNFLIELGERAKRLAHLHEVTAALSKQQAGLRDALYSIVLSLSTSFNDADCAIRLYDTKHDKFTHRVIASNGLLKEQVEYEPRRYGITRFVMKQREPLFITDTSAPLKRGYPTIRKTVKDQGVRSLAVLPLLTEEEILGVLYVNLRQPHDYTASEQEYLRIFAYQASIAITNIQLYNSLQIQREEEKLRTISRIGVELAHRLVDLVGVIPARVKLIRDNLDPAVLREERMIRELDAISEQTEQLMSATEAIKDVGQYPAQNRVIIGTLLQKAIRYVVNSNPGLERRVKLKISIPRSPLVTFTDRAQLFSLFLGLLENAVEAIPRKGEITITSNQKVIDGAKVAEVVIADNGVGIPEQYLKRLFSPFFTTKDTGWGIDLWRNKIFITEIGGRLDVDSVEGKGSLFTVVIPLQSR